MKQTKIDILLQPVNRFIHHETSGGIALFVAAVAAMVWANSPWAHFYHALWHVPFQIGFGDFVISKDLHHWINDGLMAVFFFVVGLELKREFIGGELSSFSKALLPMAAALGGMVVPAALYVAWNREAPFINGWGIPMATDIAFALGILALLGSRVPLSLKVFLTALAVVDDLGAVLVIAFFYTSEVSLENLAIGATVMALMMGGNWLGIRSSLFYGILGIGGLWLAFLLSGVHATIAGVLAAFTIPASTKIDKNAYLSSMEGFLEKFRRAKTGKNALASQEQLDVLGDIKKYTAAAESPLQRLENGMHALVAFVVMPVFALANAGISLSGDMLSAFGSTVTLGIFLGLVAGKFIGIAGMTRLVVALKLAALPQNITWRHIYGVALLAGVGFTMSLFITELAFVEQDLIVEAKLGIMSASSVAGVLGYLLLRLSPSGNTDA
ncbi:MAG: Na(+)/H(+) antiporter NhaA [Chitinophagales bacterium]|nr:MAG: Na(+)/H(+) antiporter NhaA [Chitinophagales bacterium]